MPCKTWKSGKIVWQRVEDCFCFSLLKTTKISFGSTILKISRKKKGSAIIPCQFHFTRNTSYATVSIPQSLAPTWPKRLFLWWNSFAVITSNVNFNMRPILQPFAIALWAVSQNSTDKPGGGHSNNSVVHMRDQRKAKKGCFFRLNAIRANRN